MCSFVTLYKAVSFFFFSQRFLPKGLKSGVIKSERENKEVQIAARPPVHPKKGGRMLNWVPVNDPRDW